MTDDSTLLGRRYIVAILSALSSLHDTPVNIAIINIGHTTYGDNSGITGDINVNSENI